MLLSDRIRPGALGAISAASLIVVLAAGRADAEPLFDGVWQVSIMTKKGECKSGERYPVRISSGTLVNASDTGLVIGGTVGQAGQVSVTVAHGNHGATGTGQLSGQSGSGRWSSESCSGTWTAQRRTNGRIVSYQ